MITKLSLLVVLVHYSSGLVAPKQICEEFQVDALTFLLKERTFLSIGDRFWLPIGELLTNESRSISNYCPGLNGADVAFWWGTAPNVTSCQQKRLFWDEMSLVLMQKKDAKCKWCYLLRESNNWTRRDDWNEDGTLLKEFTKEVEKRGCDKIEGIGFVNDYWGYTNKFAIVVFDGKLEKWTCANQKGQQQPVWQTALSDRIEKIYPKLPKGTRLVSIQPEEWKKQETYIKFVYSNGAFLKCREPPHQGCNDSDPIIFEWDPPCKIFRTFPTWSAPSSHSSNSSNSSKTIQIIVVILLVLLVVAIALILAVVWLYRCTYLKLKSSSTSGSTTSSGF